MNEIMEILERVRPDVDFAEEKALVSGSVLDSFDVISIVSELNDAFDIEVKPVDLVAANFDSVEAIEALVRKLED